MPITLPHFVPKSVNVELLKVSSDDLGLSRCRIQSTHLNALTEALKRGAEEFKTRYVYKRPTSMEKGGYMVSRMGENLPIGDRAYLILFGVISKTIYMPVVGERMIEIMMMPSYIASSDPVKGETLEAEYPGFEVGQFETIRQLVRDLKEVSRLYNDEVIFLDEKAYTLMKKVIETFSELKYSATEEFDHLGSVCILALKMLVERFSVAFLNKHLVNQKETEIVNIFKKSLDNESLFAFFKSWFESNSVIQTYKELVEVVKLTSVGDLKVENGRLIVDPRVYKGIYDSVINGVPNDIAERVTFYANFEQFKKDSEKIVPTIFAMRELGKPATISNSLLLLAHNMEDEIQIQGNYEGFARSLDFFKTKYASILSLFEKFVDEMFTTGPDTLLPSTKIFHQIKDGRKEIFRIDFFDPFHKNYKLFKLKIPGSQSENLMFDCKGMGEIIEAPIRGEMCAVDSTSNLYQNVSDPTLNLYGLSHISSDFIAYWKKYHSTFKIQEVGTDGNEWVITKSMKVYTVVPPSDVLRDVEICKGSSTAKERRVTPGARCEVTETNLNNNVDLVDLYFSFFGYQILGLTDEQIYNLYLSRLKTLSSTLIIGPETAYCQFDNYRVDFPNIVMMLSAGSQGFGEVILGSMKHQVIPTGCSSVSTLASRMKTKNQKLPTSLDVSLRIPISTLLPTTVTKLLTGDVTWGGSVKGKDTLRFKLQKIEPTDAFATLVIDSFVKDDLHFKNVRSLALRQDPDGKKPDGVLFQLAFDFAGLDQVDPVLGETYYVGSPGDASGLPSRRRIPDFLEYGYSEYARENSLKAVAIVFRDLCIHLLRTEGKVPIRVKPEQITNVIKRLNSYFNSGASLVQAGLNSTITVGEFTSQVESTFSLLFLGGDAASKKAKKGEKGLESPLSWSEKQREAVAELFKLITAQSWDESTTWVNFIPPCFNFNIQLMIEDLLLGRERSANQISFVDGLDLTMLDTHVYKPAIPTISSCAIALLNNEVVSRLDW